MTAFNIIASLQFILAPTEFLDDVSQFDLPSPEAQHIYIVRHGESVLNIPDENGIFCISGKSLSIPLTIKGSKQAINLGQKLIGKLPPNKKYVILSSTAFRAQETANHLFEALMNNYNVVRVTDYENLCELGHGTWEGKPKDQNYKDAIKSWEALSGKNKFLFPKLNSSESLSEVANRSLNDLQIILNQYPDHTIIIVSHWATMYALTITLNKHFESLSEEANTPMPEFNLENCDILMVEIPQDNQIQSAKISKHFQSAL